MGRPEKIDLISSAVAVDAGDTYACPMRFTAAVTHEGAWQVARCLEVEVASQGATVEEALTNLREALELYFEDEVFPEGIEPPIIATIELSA